MSITFCKDTKTFHLKANETSYVMQVVRDGYLLHVYWGRKIDEYNHSNPIQLMDRGFSGNPYKGDRTFSLDTLPLEFPQHGNTDYRQPAYQVQLENGSRVSDLRYDSHRIVKGKPSLAELPATYVEDEDKAETLELIMKDEEIGLTVILRYTVFEELNVISRSVEFVNEGTETMDLLRAMSMSVDFRESSYDFLHLYGSHNKERFIEKQSLRHGIQSIESSRGASSHQHNPFIALLEKGATETHGEVYGFNFVYSGNFLAQVEVDQFNLSRVMMGINPFNFNWKLAAGNCFQTPEVIMVYSANGLGEMSHTYHRLYREHLLRGAFKHQERPILVNNWEATYFDFDEKKLLDIAKEAKDVGVELFVLDDGWFKNRNNDKTSLGDWIVDEKKLPNGLNALAQEVNEMGMEFGLWVEPEMVSVDSDLYREHPDWCLHVPNRRRSESRNQLVLDFSRADVVEEMTKRISDALRSAPITYVKWDMNRHMTEVGSALLPADQQKEVAHRYMLGLYKMMETITTSFPHILFESCSGGGGRFDPGMLYYMPQVWTSDNTDAVSRLKIQYGTSLVYPIVTMGAHVSAVPNHQVHRSTSLQMRGDVAMSGNLGYELDTTDLTDEEKVAVREQTAIYKQRRQLIQFGDFYRLKSPFEGNETAWMFTNQEKSEAIVFYFSVLAEPSASFKRLKVPGLDTTKKYQLVGSDKIFGGDELSYVGLHIPAELVGDFQSHVWEFKEV